MEGEFAKFKKVEKNMEQSGFITILLHIKEIES